MTEVSGKSLSGIIFDWVVTREARFVDNFELEDRGKFKDVTINVELQSSLRTDKQACRVLVKVSIKPSDSSADFQIASVAVEGHFSAQGSLSIGLEDFSHKQAPAILMPFVRAELASLTSRSRLGQFLLPPINVAALAEQVDRERLEQAHGA